MNRFTRAIVFNASFLDVFIFLLLILIVASRVIIPEVKIQPDSYRYINSGLNFAEYGVLTNSNYQSETTPEPGLSMAGVYTAFEITLAIKLDENTKKNLQCISEQKKDDACNLDIAALEIIYIFEIFIFHISIWLISYIVFGDKIRAWLSVLISLGFKETSELANSVLTEPSYMMVSSVFLLVWLFAWQKRNLITLWFISGLILGILAHIKPAWNALVPAIIILSFLATALRIAKLDKIMRCVFAFILGCTLIAAPLLIRNVIQLDYWGLSDPAYFGTSLAHRLAYNSMSWYEWLIGWIYYLPDFGDSLAVSIFGNDTVQKLGFGSNSFYVYGRDTLHSLAIESTSAGEASSYLIENHLLNQPLKNIGVTALMLWRGIFLGKYFGLIAVLLVMPILYMMDPTMRKKVFILATPILIMAVVHALVSISIPRYNIPLIIIYALILSNSIYIFIKYLVVNLTRVYEHRP